MRLRPNSRRRGMGRASSVPRCLQFWPWPLRRRLGDHGATQSPRPRRFARRPGAPEFSRPGNGSLSRAKKWAPSLSALMISVLYKRATAFVDPPCTAEMRAYLQSRSSPTSAVRRRTDAKLPQPSGLVFVFMPPPDLLSLEVCQIRSRRGDSGEWRAMLPA